MSTSLLSKTIKTENMLQIAAKCCMSYQSENKLKLKINFTFTLLYPSLAPQLHQSHPEGAEQEARPPASTQTRDSQLSMTLGQGGGHL